MTYENFLEQVNLAEQLTSNDFGVSTGLISQGCWEMSKWYFVNVERGNIADKLQPRNINVSFTNNSNVAIDILIFTFYSDQLTIDVETGIVNTQFFKVFRLLESFALYHIVTFTQYFFLIFFLLYIILLLQLLIKQLQGTPFSSTNYYSCVMLLLSC